MPTPGTAAAHDPGALQRAHGSTAVRDPDDATSRAATTADAAADTAYPADAAHTCTTRMGTATCARGGAALARRKSAARKGAAAARARVAGKGAAGAA